MKRKVLALWLWAVLTGVALVLALSSGPALRETSAAFPGAVGELAFAKLVPPSGGAWHLEIFVANPDGSGELQLTNNPGSNLYIENVNRWPDWSPDGTKIAFASNRDGNYEIYVMNADGTNQTRLTNNADYDSYPAWSPDGSKIAFTSDRDHNFIYAHGEVYVMNSDGSEPVRLTNSVAGEFSPNWSPDGTRIVFTSDRDGNDEVYVMDSDGTHQINLTNDPSNADWWGDWSPSGSKIVYEVHLTEGSAIYKMGSDGGGKTRLTFNDDGQAAWAPDSSKIAFVRLGQVWTMWGDGTHQTDISNDPEAFYQDPAWQRTLSPSVGGIADLTKAAAGQVQTGGSSGFNARLGVCIAAAGSIVLIALGGLARHARSR